MCGITAIVNHGKLEIDYLRSSNSIISHRGPDDEGFLTWQTDSNSFNVFAGKDTSKESLLQHQLNNLEPDDLSWKVALGHRRLSIIDVSAAGHQPMVLQDRFAITFNGEIYNYIEIREELQALGHQFHTASDTEVILQAWQEWGVKALSKFNGIFSFVLIDNQEKKLFAVRDHFGVKPLYYTHTKSYTAFASEAKQLRVLPEYHFLLNKQIAFDYLRFGKVDHTSDTFEVGISQVAPGHYIELDLLSGLDQLNCWYTLKPKVWKGTDKEAIETFRSLLADSVKLQMRADVTVGSALSGGLDSSTIVYLMRSILNEQGHAQQAIKTISSCSEVKQYDEWEYAALLVKQTNADYKKVFPSFEKLKTDLDLFLWHMDYPFGSTSQFSQWCVFEAAQKEGLKVMLNGQGADEQLAGYRGNDMSLYIGLLSKAMFKELVKEVKAYRSYKGVWPTEFLIGAVQQKIPSWIMNKIPDRFRVFKQYSPAWLNAKGMDEAFVWPGSLNESLQNQIKIEPLPSLLRYEDRTSMAFSIESRVPFMDYRLVEFTLGLPENLVYRRGERKYVLRQAFKGVLPGKIIQRKDKLGFATAEEIWMKNEGAEWFNSLVDQAGTNSEGFIKHEEALQYLQNMQSGKVTFNFDPWRMICFYKWLLAINNLDNKMDKSRC